MQVGSSLSDDPTTVVGGVAAAGGRGDEIVAGHVREAAEVDAVAEPGLARRELLVAACRDVERVTGDDGVGEGLPQLDGGRRAGGMAADFLGAAGVGAGGESEKPAREETVGEGGEAAGGDVAQAGRGD